MSLVDLLKEGARHFSGLEEAILKNIDACRELSAIVRTSLGPNGMKKMVINSHDKLFVTSDASTIIQELDVIHPAAKMVVTASKQMESEIGDNTNMVVIFCGELLQQAASLLNQGLHVNDIITGYNKALEKTLSYLEELEADRVGDVRDIEQLQKPLKSAIAAKMWGQEDFIAPIVAQAVLNILPQNAESFNVDNIRVCKVLGGGVSDSFLVRGFVLTKTVEGTIRRVKDAKVVVLGGNLEPTKPETKAVVLMTKPEELLALDKDEEQLMEESIKFLVDAGVNVVVVGGNVAAIALHYCEKYKIMVIKENSKFQLRRIARATGAVGLLRIAGKPTAEEIGLCDEVAMEELGSTKVVFFRNNSSRCQVSTIVIRGSTQHIIENVERAVDDAVNVAKVMIRDPRLVAGAGATEIELAKRLLNDAASPGLDQYAVNKFAEAFEVIPRTLAENAGTDATYLVTSLIASHQQGNKFDGIDVEEGKIGNAVDLKVYDTFLGKHWMIKLATDVTLTILLVDQIIMMKTAGGPKPPQMGGARDDD